jgi:hypothetical protein
MEALARHRERQNAERLWAEEKWPPEMQRIGDQPDGRRLILTGLISCGGGMHW